MSRQSPRDFHGPVVLRVGPAVVGNNRSPIRPPWVPVIWIITQALVQFTVLAQLVAVQLDAETWLRWNGDSAVLVAHRAALDDVISQVVITGGDNGHPRRTRGWGGRTPGAALLPIGCQAPRKNAPQCRFGTSRRRLRRAYRRVFRPKMSYPAAQYRPPYREY